MLRVLACLLLVACVCLVPARSDFDEKDFARSNTDIHKESQWATTHNGFAKDGRRLNEYESGEHANPSTREDEMEGTRGKRSETSQGKDDHSNDEAMRGEKNGTTEFEKGRMGKGGKKCDGAIAKKKGESPRNLRARGEHEAEPESECDEEDDGLGLPVILGIQGAALLGVLAFGVIAILCSRRRISTKSVPGPGVIVMGQPVTKSMQKGESNENGNAPEGGCAC